MFREGFVVVGQLFEDGADFLTLEPFAVFLGRGRGITIAVLFFAALFFAEDDFDAAGEILFCLGGVLDGVAAVEVADFDACFDGHGY